MNKWQRKIRNVSDAHLDDTAIEIGLLDDARELVRQIRLSMADGQVTVAEMIGCMAVAMRVYGECEVSYQGNLAVESGLTLLAQDMDMFSADARGRNPALGMVTIGELIRNDDWVPQAA